MQTEISRRAFCGASLALALSPSLSFVGIQAPGPDDKILSAVAEWERVARISDGHLTFATNTRAVTADGIEAKLRLYRASLAYFGDDSDDYMMARIEADLAALSHGVEA